MHGNRQVLSFDLLIPAPMKKDYTNGEITITWQPELCQHAGVCVRTLPQVYKPGSSPWISMENASTEELKEQVNRCPSGALRFTETLQDQ